MHAFILAGGFATRLWPLTEKRAKPLLPLAGKPIITHIVEKIPKDIPVTVSTNAVFKEGFESWRKELGRENLEILIEDTLSDDQKLGALGAVSQWIQSESINEDVLLLTGDNYFGFEISDFTEAYSNGTPLLAAFDISDKNKAKSFGVVLLEDDGKSIKGFEEKPKEPSSTIVSTGCSILPKSSLPVLVEYAKKKPDNVGGIFEEFLSQKISIECFTFSDPWFDIGSFEAYLEATRELVGEKIVLEEGASLEHTNCEGSVVVGVGSKVNRSELKDVVIFEGSTIEDCNLENCIIDLNCSLKGVDLRGKMIREKTNLTSKK
ncbi:MAG: sugar phosphate nucleotidyltransferase [Candidatus Peribacteraceae bacterium]|jgi:glucose-1-phosphate thymidylyltransferase|nr:sugar phosphate nucleotidyltransferase [Candidatus Peribacteraceae bacterium]HCI03399.1 hypothetical protein [Candidatus Peribacteria bacterium]|tara:strand:- start:3480 stop:4439 length:960 start_codon:yes stop_codon:yes gene_type:complete